MVWVRIKKMFQRKKPTTYLRVTLVFLQYSGQWENLISVFPEFSASINKTFILGGWMDARVSFYEI